MILLLSAKAFSSLETRGLAFLPADGKPLHLYLFVDNKKYLEKPFLEITLPKDRHQNRVVALTPVTVKGAELRGEAEMIVSSGPVELLICGMVSCPALETELMCANVEIPAQIQVGLTHDVTFSTDWACSRPVKPLVLLPT